MHGLENEKFLKDQIILKKLYSMYLLIFSFIAYAGAFDGLIQLFKGTCLWIFFLLAVFTIFIIGINYSKDIKINNAWIVWILIGIVLRIVYYCLVQTIQISDFNQATQFYQYLNVIGGYNNYTSVYSELDQYQIYYSLYPSWGAYMFIVHGIYKLFGVHPSLLVAVNIILSGFTLFLYAKLMDEIYVNEKKKNIIIALLACFPQMIMWDSIACPDHFTIFFFGVLVYIWCKSLRSENIGLYLLAEAVCISIIELLKPLTIFLIILLVCAEVFIMIFRNYGSAKKHITRILLSIVLVIGICKGVNYGNQILLKNYIKTDVQQATSFYVLWGYSLDEYGNWDADAGDNTINQAFKSADTISDVITYTDEAARRTLKEAIPLLPRILQQKFKLLFYTDNWAVLWSLTNNDNVVVKWLNTSFSVAGDILTVFNSFSLFIMPFALIRKNELTIFLSLGWIGYICFLVLSGIQTRYRYIMLPFQLVLSGLGYMELKGLLHEKRRS